MEYHRITGGRLGYVKTTLNLFKKGWAKNNLLEKGWTKNLQPMEKQPFGKRLGQKSTTDGIKINNR
jgi:hypothetical protein